MGGLLHLDFWRCDCMWLVSGAVMSILRPVVQSLCAFSLLRSMTYSLRCRSSTCIQTTCNSIQRIQSFHNFVRLWKTQRQIMTPEPSIMPLDPYTSSIPNFSRLIIIPSRRLSMVINHLHLPIPPVAPPSIMMVAAVSAPSLKLNVQLNLVRALSPAAPNRL